MVALYAYCIFHRQPVNKKTIPSVVTQTLFYHSLSGQLAAYRIQEKSQIIPQPKKPAYRIFVTKEFSATFSPDTQIV